MPSPPASRRSRKPETPGRNRGVSHTSGTFRTFRTIRNIPRLKDISFILLKHGLHQVTSSLGGPIRYRLRRLFSRPVEDPISQAARLRMAFQELGPIFIKLGQIIASRPDLFPEVLVAEFAKLESRVDPVPFPAIKAVLEEDYGRDPTKLFRDIEEKPLASASIAQIHRARTLEGDEVILKVQKPGVLKIIERDMDIFSLVAHALSNIEGLQSIDPEGLAGEVKRSLERELNFSFERNALDRVRENFKDDDVLVVPRTYPELSTHRILVMEYLDGTPLRQHEPKGDEGADIARECSRILFQMVFRDGYFHGDPHPSNILVLPGGKLGWIDFGSMGLFTAEMRARLVKLLRALLKRDYTAVARVVLRLGRSRSDVSVFDFSQDLASRLDPYFGLTLQEVDLAALLSTVLNLARDHGVSIAPGFILMTRCLVLMEGVTHKLDPNFNTMSEMTPLVRKYLLERYRPDHMAKDLEEKLRELAGTLWEYPHHTGEILRKMAQGRFHVESHLEGLNRFGKRMETSSIRIVEALIVSALLVSSSMLINSEIGPSIWGFSAVGLTGYVIAGLIATRILFSIIRK